MDHQYKSRTGTECEKSEECEYTPCVIQCKLSYHPIA